MSMKVFHQTTPKLLCFPSAFCNGRRIPHSSSHFLVSSPATMEFNTKFCHGIQHCSCKSVRVSPAQIEFNPKFLHFLPHHGIQDSSYKSVLVSPTAMKFSLVPFAMPRDNEEFSFDNEENPIIQEHEERHTSVSSDNVHEEQSKKVSRSEIKKVEFGEYVVREATVEVDFWASAWLKTEGIYEDRSHERHVGSFKKKHAEQEFNVITRRFRMRTMRPFMCIIAVRKENEIGLNGMLKNVIGTLDYRVEYLLQGETYPEEFMKTKKFTTFKKRGSQRYGMISNVTVVKSARQQGVASSMLKFPATWETITYHVLLLVRRDNKPALELYRKMGFTILAKATPQLEERNLYMCSINL